MMPEDRNPPAIKSLHESNLPESAPSLHPGLVDSPQSPMKDNSQNITMLPEGFEPGEYDVICGRGGRGKKSFHHLGNSYFRDLVASCLEQYAKASKVEKSFVLSDVVNQVRRLSPNGGFVKKDQSSGRWHKVDDWIAREKASQAFRDALHDLYKSSSTSKKRRKHAERTVRHFLQYHREHSNASPGKDDLQASEHRSLGSPSSSGSATTNPGVTGLAVSAYHQNIAYPLQGFTQSNSNVSIDSPATLMQLQQEQLSTRSLQLQPSPQTLADALFHSCPNMKFKCDASGGSGGFQPKNQSKEQNMTQGDVPLPALSMQQQLLARSLQLQLGQDGQKTQQPSARSVTDPLRRSCPNIKTNQGLGGGSYLDDATKVAIPLPVLSIPQQQQQFLARSLQVQWLQEQQQKLQKTSARSATDPLRRSCPNIKIGGGIGSQTETTDDMAQGAVPFLQKQLPPFARSNVVPSRRSCPNIKIDGGIIHFQELNDMTQSAPLLQKPNELQQPSARSVTDSLRRSCPNIKIGGGTGSFHLESHAEEPEMTLSVHTEKHKMTQGVVPLLEERQQLQQPSESSATDSLRSPSQNINDSSDVSCGKGTFHFKSHADEKASEIEELDMTQSSHTEELDIAQVPAPLPVLSTQQEQNTRVSQQKGQAHDVMFIDVNGFNVDDNLIMSDIDLRMDGLEDTFDRDMPKNHQLQNSLFDSLMHLTESNGIDSGNPFEPEPIPESK